MESALGTPRSTPPQKEQAVGKKTGRFRPQFSSTEAKLFVFVALMIAAFSFIYPEVFPTSSNLANMSRVVGILIVVSIGQMFALLIGGFDLSVGANMGMVSTVVALQLTGGHGVAESAAMGVGAGALVGLVNGVLISVLRISPFVVTLGTLTFLGGFADQISGGASVSGLPASFGVLGRDNWGPFPSSISIAAIVTALSWVVLARSRIGLYVYSIGGSEETSRVSGVPVVRYQIIAYTLCGLLAGVAGVMLASRIAIGQASLGTGYELQSIATAIIGGVVIGGGIGRLSGVLLGAVLLTVLTTGMNIAGLNTFIQQMVTGVVLVAAVIFARAQSASWPNFKSLLRPRQPKPGSGGGVDPKQGE